VFISHAWDYNEDYYRLVRMLDEAPHFSWTNLSVPEHDPVSFDDLKYELNNRMRPANVVLVLSGMYAAHSEWMDYEIAFARRIGRPLVAIWPWGQQRIPAAIQEAADAEVGWKTSTIVDAIRAWALQDGI
jgi:hypothetical protein